MNRKLKRIKYEKLYQEADNNWLIDDFMKARYQDQKCNDAQEYDENWYDEQIEELEYVINKNSN